MSNHLPQDGAAAPPSSCVLTLPADLFEQLDALGMSDGKRVVYLRALFEAKDGFIPVGALSGRTDKIESLVRRGFFQPASRPFGAVVIDGFEIPLLTRGALR